MNIEHLIQPKADEHVVFFLRRHWVFFISQFISFMIMGFLPVVGYILLSAFSPEILAGVFSRPALILLASSFYLLMFMSLLTKFVDYYLDVWVVTNDRILNVEQHGLFSRTVSELDLSKVQDVTSEVHGFWASVFGYGNVAIQTAGEKERFIFEQVPGPDEVRKQLLELVEKDRMRQGETYRMAAGVSAGVAQSASPSAPPMPPGYTPSVPPKDDGV
jgi:uncharacterized membrane protein YdbT with pleckstrin-like domain